jgi:hypothetical protein
MKLLSGDATASKWLTSDCYLLVLATVVFMLLVGCASADGNEPEQSSFIRLLVLENSSDVNDAINRQVIAEHIEQLQREIEVHRLFLIDLQHRNAIETMAYRSLPLSGQVVAVIPNTLQRLRNLIEVFQRNLAIAHRQSRLMMISANQDDIHRASP